MNRFTTPSRGVLVVLAALVAVPLTAGHADIYQPPYMPGQFLLTQIKSRLGQALADVPGQLSGFAASLKRMDEDQRAFSKEAQAIFEAAGEEGVCVHKSEQLKPILKAMDDAETSAVKERNGAAVILGQLQGAVPALNDLQARLDAIQKKIKASDPIVRPYNPTQDLQSLQDDLDALEKDYNVHMQAAMGHMEGAGMSLMMAREKLGQAKAILASKCMICEMEERMKDMMH